MSTDEAAEHHDGEPKPNGDDLPAIEDAYEGDMPIETEEMAEDDPQLLNGGTRALQVENDQADAGVSDGETKVIPDAAGKTGDDDDINDAAAIRDDKASGDAAEPPLPNWDRECSAHKIAVALKRIETEVRELLEPRDTRRKRKLSGTRRWRELEEDILAWRFAGRMDESTLQRLHELVIRRHHLFRRLHFMAGTRPAWNT